MLAYRGDPETGEVVPEPAHASEVEKIEWSSLHHIWDLGKVKDVIADHSHAVSFFCGGCRNFHHFIDSLDGVFILEVADLETINRRMDKRVERDPTDFGGKPEEKEVVARLHASKEGLPKSGIVIDSTAPLAVVVNKVLSYCSQMPRISRELLL